MSVEFYKNFELAYKQLSAFIKQGIEDDLDRAGLIQAFEFTFEQAWKALQKKASDEGVTINSPKQAFSWALQLGWINQKDEKIWLQMLKDRNLTSHTYRAALAKSVCENIETQYQRLFEILLKSMKK